ncbi:MAG: tripartite tricarboxylate transporter permease [Succinivibrionaceae bacterium]|nr:tripartite tricarboxylate transporter permease [Succinivibrionaceae bacterium]
MFDLATMSAGFALLLDPQVILVIVCSGLYGLFIGSMPGLTATMAVALLVPITFYMPAVPAVASIITMAAMAIFSGDIPGTLLHIPGTPSSAAYCNDSYALAKKGFAARVLGTDLALSALGGLFGSLVLLTMAPMLAEIALQFSSFEFFWLAVLGLSCAVLISTGSTVKGMISLLIGLLINCIGLDITLGFPRFTMGAVELFEGFNFIPAMIGMFGLAEIFRNVSHKQTVLEKIAMETEGVFSGIFGRIRDWWKQILRSATLGTSIGILPGAGGDIAAWICYGIAKKFSKHPEEYGYGSLESIANSSTANNAAISGAFIPAFVFGIPGDSITAIVIGVLYMKGLQPGPSMFQDSADFLFAIYMVFILANILIIPLGWLAVRLATKIMYVPSNLLHPIVIGFCIVGAFAINNINFDIVAMLGFGVVAYFMLSNGIPVAPAILGLVLGDMLENTFMQSMMKSGWDLTSFFERPISATLGVLTILLWLSPLIVRAVRRAREQRA